MLKAGENDERFESSVLFNGASCLHPDSQGSICPHILLGLAPASVLPAAERQVVLPQPSPKRLS